MMFSRQAQAAIAAAVALGSTVVCAAELRPPGPSGVAATLPPVEVQALRDPVEKSYRKVVQGMDVFEQRRSLAPNAPLRFKLLPRSREMDMQGVALHIVSDSASMPIQVAPDGTFALERNARAMAENAVIAPNRRAGRMTWRTDIRTPDLPPGTRRLGDLRLECLVGVEADLVSDFRPFFGHIARLLRPRDYCNQREVHYLFFTERPLFSVTLVATEPSNS
jgi:hypothetical protein